MTNWPQLVVIALSVATLVMGIFNYEKHHSLIKLTSGVFAFAIYQYILYCGGFYAVLGYAP